jgi:hypothetical protein
MRREERDGLRRIRRAHLWFWIVLCVWAPILWIALRHTDQHRIVLTFTIVWGIVVLASALHVARMRCPRCGERFHSKGVIPSWRPLINRSRCKHCGLPLRVERVIYPSME